MRLPEVFRSLRSRDLRVFFVAQTVSQIATWMHSVAQACGLATLALLMGARRRRDRRRSTLARAIDRKASTG